MPDERTLARVAAYLDERRVIGTRVGRRAARSTWASPWSPGWSAGSGSSAARLHDDALAALYGYFSPIRGRPRRQRAGRSAGRSGPGRSTGCSSGCAASSWSRTPGCSAPTRSPAPGAAPAERLDVAPIGAGVLLPAPGAWSPRADVRGLVDGLASPHPIGALLPALYQEDEFAQRFTSGLDDVLAPAICGARQPRRLPRPGPRPRRLPALAGGLGGHRPRRELAPGPPAPDAGGAGPATSTGPAGHRPRPVRADRAAHRVGARDRGVGRDGVVADARRRPAGQRGGRAGGARPGDTRPSRRPSPARIDRPRRQAGGRAATGSRWWPDDRLQDVPGAVRAEGAQFCGVCGGFVDYVGRERGVGRPRAAAGSVRRCGRRRRRHRADTAQMACAASAANDAEQRALAEAEAKDRSRRRPRPGPRPRPRPRRRPGPQASAETDADAKAKAENEARAQAAAKAKAEADAAAAAKAAEASRRAAAMIAKPRPRPTPPSRRRPSRVPTTPADPKPATTVQRRRRRRRRQPKPGELACGQCGTGNPPTRTFCRQCGAQLGAGGAGAAVAAAAPKRSGGMLRSEGAAHHRRRARPRGRRRLLPHRDDGGGGTGATRRRPPGDHGRRDAARPTDDREVTVDATRSFVDTGLALAVGDHVEIVARGEAHSGGTGRRGPEGDRNPGLRQFNMMPTAATTPSSPRSASGASRSSSAPGSTFDAEEAGPLFLGVNDTGVNNNSGGYVAEITVSEGLSMRGRWRRGRGRRSCRSCSTPRRATSTAPSRCRPSCGRPAAGRGPQAADNARRLGMSRRDFLRTSMGAATVLLALNACSKEEAANRGTTPGGTFAVPKEAGVDEDDGRRRSSTATPLPVIDAQAHFLEFDLTQPLDRDFFGSGFPQAQCGAVRPPGLLRHRPVRRHAVHPQRDGGGGAVGRSRPRRPHRRAQHRGHGPGPAADQPERRRRAAAHPRPGRAHRPGAVGRPRRPRGHRRDATRSTAGRRTPPTPRAGGSTTATSTAGRWAWPRCTRSSSSGIPRISIHKGISGGDKWASPEDVGPAAKVFPEVKFAIYHSGWEPGVTEERVLPRHRRPGVEPAGGVAAQGGDRSRPERLRRAGLHLVQPHALARRGRPPARQAAAGRRRGPHPVGHGLHLVRVAAGQIDAFRTFDISPEFQERFGYPALTDKIKGKILARNAAEYYGLDLAQIDKRPRPPARLGRGAVDDVGAPSGHHRGAPDDDPRDHDHQHHRAALGLGLGHHQHDVRLTGPSAGPGASVCSRPRRSLEVRPTGFPRVTDASQQRRRRVMDDPGRGPGDDSCPGQAAGARPRRDWSAAG